MFNLRITQNIAGTANKMSMKQPVIKFSPFEALLIGEKNKVLKRQPMKNTIFVKRLYQPQKNINLRVLFGVDEDATKPGCDEVAFKMPQRVRDFLKIRKLRNKNHNSTANNKKIFSYEFEGEEMIVKSNNLAQTKNKKAKLKSNKVKFKRMFNHNNKENLVSKLSSQSVKKNSYQERCKKNVSRSVLKDIKRKKPEGNRHLLRGKDGKFISKNEYQKLKLKEISPKQRYITKYLHQLFLNKNKKFFQNCKQNESSNTNEFSVTHKIEAIIGVPLDQIQFDIRGSETALNEISKKYYEDICFEEFKFPNYPQSIDSSDFDVDSNLVDLIYENFPKVIQFGNNNDFDDFSEALKHSNIVKCEKSIKIYEKKTNSSLKNSNLSVIFNSSLPCIKLKKINNLKSSHASLKNGYESVIDEPYTKNSHLITGESFGSFFFRSVEGKDIFIGDLVKPFLQNSWFGRIPDVET